MRFFIILILLALQAVPGRALADDEPAGEFFKKEAPVEITADSLHFDRATSTYHATGSVSITQDNTILKAERVEMNTSTGLATAEGGVAIIDEGGNTLSGESLEFNVRAKTAVVAKARLFYRVENIHITGDPIEKTGLESYRARRLTYTTCDCEEGASPAWHFSVSEADVTVGEFLRGRHTTFNIKGVPVLYSPYVKVPVKRERQTGLLQPKPGYSKLRGFVLKNSFFWAIAGNRDATLYLDLETTRGLGKGAEYRYMRTMKSHGELFFYHYKEKDLDRVREFRQGVENLSRPLSASSDRWLLRYSHFESLPGGVSLRARINVVSDDEYFIDFGKSSQERSLESLESNISLSKNWSASSLVAQLRYYDNLLVEGDSATLQSLPEVRYTVSDSKAAASPFYVSLDSSLIHFYRENGTRGQRLDVKPRISLPMNPGGHFEFKPSIAPRATLYLVSNDPGGKYFERYIYEAKTDLTTTFSRVYGKPGEKAVKHSIRPKLTHTYVPEAVQSDLPSFDAADRVAAANSLTYSINSVVTARSYRNASPVYVDHLYLDLSQSYNINEATRKLAFPGEQRRPFSDVSGEAIIRPKDNMLVTARGKYNPYDHWFTSYDASLSASDARGDSVSVSYRFTRSLATYIEGSARVKVALPLDFIYVKRYSFDEDRSLETVYGLEYRHQCWDAVLTYTERLEEKLVLLTFNLSGIGRIAGISGKIESK